MAVCEIKKASSITQRFVYHVEINEFSHINIVNLYVTHAAFYWLKQNYYIWIDKMEKMPHSTI